MVKKEPSPGARDRAPTLRRAMTEAERRLWQMLRSRQTQGCRFRRQVPIGRFIADFVCYEAKLIVEIDGGQHDPPTEEEASRTRFLEGEGYRMLRFWNNEVLGNREGVHAAIADALHHATPTPTLPHRGGGCERQSARRSAAGSSRPGSRRARSAKEEANPLGPRWCETRQTTPIPYRRGVVIGPSGIVCIAAGAHHRRGVPPSKLTGAR